MVVLQGRREAGDMKQESGKGGRQTGDRREC